MELVVGIDIGGTNTKIGIVDVEGNVLANDSIPTDSLDLFEKYTNRVFLKTTEMLEEFRDRKLKGIGVGAPNANSLEGTIDSPPNLKWEKEYLVRDFRNVFKTDVFLENDANVAAVGERIWGIGKGVDDFIVVTLGTGIGTGIFTGGELLRGPNGMAGEGGHLTIIPGGRHCHCGGMGHLECYGSVRGIKITTKEVTDLDLKFAEISDRYKAKEKEFLEIFDITAKYLAMGLSNMQVLFCPKVFVLSGGISNIGLEFAENVENYMNEMSYPVFKDQTKVKISNVSSEHGAILGAASLVLH